MIPVRYDFRFWTNSDYSETIVLTADGGEPVDLTGYSINAQFRRTSADPTILFSLATVVTPIQGFLIVDNGFEIRVDKETLATAYTAIDTNATVGSPVALVADIRVTLPSGEIETWFDCTCEINYGVTR